MDPCVVLQLEVERLKLLLREAVIVLPQARGQPDDLGDKGLDDWINDFNKRVGEALGNLPRSKRA
jgi:hypothetical protein